MGRFLRKNTTMANRNQRTVSAIEDKLSHAKSSLQTGKVSEAEAILSSILKTEPQQFDALHLLGIANYMQGKLEVASGFFLRAIEIHPQSAKTFYNLGIVHNARKEYQNAVQCFQRALDLDSGDPDVSCALGDSLAALDRHGEAIDCYKRAIAADNDNAEALGKLGIALSKLGRLDEAVAHYRKAIGIKPDYAEAHYNLGTTFSGLGRLDDAVAHFRKAIGIKPDYTKAHGNLGIALSALGQPDDAVAHFRKAIDIKPDFAEAHSDLATALKELGRLDEAVAHYHKAIDIKPDYAEAHSNLGIALSELGRQDDAVTHFRKAIEIDPDHAKAHSNLGTTLSELGRLDEGVAHFRKAIDINPDFAEAHRQLTFSKTHSKYDDDIRIMEEIFAQPDITDEQRMHLAFGLGKSFEDLQQYEKAFEFFAEGNAIMRRTFSFEIETWDAHFEKLKETFDGSLFDRHQGVGCRDETPIFVLGMPRSGTTLIEQILASHPKVHAAGELNILSKTINASFDERTYPKDILHVDGDVFERLGGEYIHQVREKSKSATFITDKMPHNFIHIGMIKLMLPNAKIIHCKRSPKDTCLSIFKTYFANVDHTYAYDQNELGQYYNLYRELMAHWHSVLPGFIHEIQYEDIVSDQEEQTRALLAHSDLEWNDACLKFYKTDRTVKTASAAQVRKPIYKGSVQSWKRYETQLEPLLKALQVTSLATA